MVGMVPIVKWPCVTEFLEMHLRSVTLTMVPVTHRVHVHASQDMLVWIVASQFVLVN